MNVIGAIVAGLAGTAVMTMMMVAAPPMRMPKMDIAGMLGAMVISKKETAAAVGMVMHFMMGAMFGLIYALVWNAGVGSVTASWGLIFGAAHAVAAMGMMPVMMRMHPRPPEMAGGPSMLAGLLMGHLVFGLVLALVYAAF